jgi:hypothetical protein
VDAGRWHGFTLGEARKANWPKTDLTKVSYDNIRKNAQALETDIARP